MMNKHSHEPVALDEGYWQALLNEGEIAHTVSPASLETWRAVAAGPQEIPANDRPTTASPEESWQVALNAQGSGEVCTAKVVGYNRGGLLVDWQDLRGFVPASHLVGLSPVMDEESRKAEFARRVGWTLCVKVIEVDRTQGRLILSERATSSEESRREALWEDLCEGAVRRGYVTNVCAFGAFVDLGGLEGLIHISEISWNKVQDPREFAKVGDKVEVQVIGIEGDKISLSMKRLLEDQWLNLIKDYKVGQVVKGEIMQIMPFGVFVKVDDKIDGLIHISELSFDHVTDPSEVVKVGDKPELKVIDIEPESHRFGLSLKAMKMPADAIVSAPKKSAAGSLSALGLSDALIRKLKSAGIESTADLKNKSVDEIKAIKGIGEKSAAKIIEALK